MERITCIIKLLDKIKNEMKNITIECYNVLGEYNKKMRTSNGLYKCVRPVELVIIIKG